MNEIAPKEAGSDLHTRERVLRVKRKENENGKKTAF